MLSDEDKADFVADGLSAARQEQFRKAEFDPRPPMTMEQYLQWLADVARWSGVPPPRHLTRCTWMLL